MAMRGGGGVGLDPHARGQTVFGAHVSDPAQPRAGGIVAHDPGLESRAVKTGGYPPLQKWVRTPPTIRSAVQASAGPAIAKRATRR